MSGNGMREAADDKIGERVHIQEKRCRRRDAIIEATLMQPPLGCVMSLGERRNLKFTPRARSLSRPGQRRRQRPAPANEETHWVHLVGHHAAADITMRWVGAAEKGFLPHGRWCWMVWIAASVSCVYGADRGARDTFTRLTYWADACLPLHTLARAPTWLSGWDFYFYFPLFQHIIWLFTHWI